MQLVVTEECSQNNYMADKQNYTLYNYGHPHKLRKTRFHLYYPANISEQLNVSPEFQSIHTLEIVRYIYNYYNHVVLNA